MKYVQSFYKYQITRHFDFATYEGYQLLTRYLYAVKYRLVIFFSYCLPITPTLKNILTKSGKTSRLTIINRLEIKEFNFHDYYALISGEIIKRLTRKQM